MGCNYVGHRITGCYGDAYGRETNDRTTGKARRAKAADGATLWREGTILSTNHGRLVVLPYVKENGELVRGHTKNGPGDGRAKLRHPGHFVEIPFRELKGDLMVGLFGELPYE